MELTLRILLSVLTIICFLGGLNILIKGAGYFLPKGCATLPVLDNLIRFLSGIYFGLGFLLVWSIINLQNIQELIYFIGIIVVFSGLGRLYSRSKVGSAGRYSDFITAFEILIGLTLIVLEFYRLK